MQFLSFKGEFIPPSWLTFACMKGRNRYIPLVFALVLCLSARAQEVLPDEEAFDDAATDAEGPAYIPLVKVGKVVDDSGDSLQYVEMNNIYVYPEMTFSSAKERAAYNRLVYNVKKVLPMAKEVNVIIRETYEYLQTLPDKKSRAEHMKRVEISLRKEYGPRMRKLTYSQGKLLIKLVYRECNSSTYALIQAFLGPVRAGMYQAFAWTFGASLTKQYKPETTDKLTERVVRMVEAGQI